MSNPLLIFDPETGELRNNPEAFGEKNDYVAAIVWETVEGRKVTQGDTIASIQWGNGMIEPLAGPEGCSGRVEYLNRNIRFEDLEYSPSQVLARIS